MGSIDMKILYGTGNKAKVEAMKKIIKVHGFDAELFTIKDIGFDQDVEENGITFEGFRRVYVCKKIYAQRFEKDCFVDSQDIIDRYYEDEPCHNFYVGQIIDVLEQ